MTQKLNSWAKYQKVATGGLGVDHPTTAKISENLKLLRDKYA
ncbi:hypothetical protein [Aetokthonos hydrillicola]